MSRGRNRCRLEQKGRKYRQITSFQHGQRDLLHRRGRTSTGGVSVHQLLKTVPHSATRPSSKQRLNIIIVVITDGVPVRRRRESVIISAAKKLDTTRMSSGLAKWGSKSETEPGTAATTLPELDDMVSCRGRRRERYGCSERFAFPSHSRLVRTTHDWFERVAEWFSDSTVRTIRVY